MTVSPATSAAGLRAWIQGTALSAVAITTLDAALLQQKKAFFTGGFLAGIHANGLQDAAGFLAISLVVDASIAGALAALVLLASARLRLTHLARLALVGAGALAPLVTWDVVNYSLLTHLGDAFDLGLMFDLTGRDASEVFAVASSHLLLPGALLAAAVAALAALVWTINRYGATAARARASGRPSWTAAGLLVIGLLTFAVTTAASDLVEDGLRRKASGQFFTHLLASVTDFDGDGFGLGGRTADPAPFDANVYPYALDIPGNGIDENAVGGDLPVDGRPYVEEVTAAAAWRQRPDVVLFALESFRADAVGRLVNGRAVTPVMDALARQGVSSTRAFSHNGYTTQSRFHLLTGSLAGLRQGSLIDDFTAQGYETAYFSAQDESFGGPAFGVGFERADVAYDARQDRDRRYSTFTTAGSLAVSHGVLRERIEEFLRRRNPSRPLFLYVNFHDTHFPYHHREIEALVSDRAIGQGQIAPRRAIAVREMYDNTAANVDRAVGATVDLVTRLAGREPAVIVTADHGESLFDEGFLGHGYALNDAQTRIPLIVRGLPLEIAEPFGQVDLRGAIAAALAREDAGVSVKPRAFADPGKVVFQYLGNIHRPRQIGFATGNDRLIYDFRDRRVRRQTETSGRPEAVSDEHTSGVLGLVHFWERMMLARAAGDRSRDE